MFFYGLARSALFPYGPKSEENRNYHDVTFMMIMIKLLKSKFAISAVTFQAGAALFLGPEAQALTYSDSSLDCMLCFRQQGVLNPYDLEVDLGSVTNFYGVPMGQTITITNYTVAQLANAMGSTTFGKVEFSVCVGNWAHQTGVSTNYPRGIMWVTFARSDVNTQSAPFARSSAALLISASAVVNNLGGQATAYSGQINSDPLANTPTAVAIPPNNSQSCENYIGPGLNSMLNGKFPQPIGQYAPSPFGAAIRSDFYVDYPNGYPDPLNANATTGNVSLIGYFTFNTDGTMTFTRASASSVAPPVASFTASPRGGFAPLTVVFTDSSTGAITNRLWNFGDGNSVTNSTGGNVTNTYTAAGAYTVTLTVSGPGGSSTNAQVAYISVTSNARPVASFTGAPTNGFAALQVVFTNSSTGSITNWLWNFGDGHTVTNSTGGNVTNTYALAGNYTVTLTVTGAGGSSTNIQTGYVVASPTPKFGRPQLQLSGGNFVLSGTNCPAGVRYRILSSTNVALALSSWTPVVTNTFLSDGSYSFTNSATKQVIFFRLVSP